MFARRQLRRRAGASAAREYERLRREWLQRNRRVFRGLLVGCGLVVAASLVLGYGNVRGWIGGFAAGLALAFYVLARNTPPAWIGQYQAGAFGEERTAKALEPLLRSGWFITHDLDRRRFNIDHVLVGPAGVFVLETKNLHGSVTIDGDVATLTRPGRDRPDYHGPW